MLRALIFVTILIPLVAILLGSIEDARYVSLPKPKSLGAIHNRSPPNSNAFGRYTRPLPALDYSWVTESKLFNFVNLKHWDFKSISTPRYFIVTAMADFNYIAHAFVYVIDRTNRQAPAYQYSGRSLLSQAIKEQAASSLTGCTHFEQSPLEYVRHCYDKRANRYEINASVPFADGVRVSLDFSVDYSADRDAAMVLLYPVEPTRPAYTHKVAGLPSRGHISLSDANGEQDLQNGLSSMDWTLAYSERISRWKWVSLSVVGRDAASNESITIGINLSDKVYNDADGISMENAVWIAGKVYTTGRISYELPEKEHQSSRPWQIYSSGEVDAQTPQIRLTFQPWGSQNEQINVFLLTGDFVQAFGTYDGTVELAGRKYLIENAFGVAENHYAKW